MAKSEAKPNTQSSQNEENVIPPKSSETPAKPESPEQDKVNNPKDQDKKYRIAYSTLIILPIVLISALLGVFFSKSIDNSNWFLVWSVFLLINIFFIVYICFRNESINESILTGFFTLMLLNVSAFPIYAIFNEYNDKANRDVKYSIGFRAWGSTIDISDINITYFDKYDNPHDVLDLFDKKKWTCDTWGNKVADTAKKYCVSIVDQKKNRLLVRNCGIVFSPDEFNGSKNFLVTATFSLHYTENQFLKSVNSDINYYTAQICLMVPKNKENDKYSENYFAYEFFFNDFTMSKLRIPGLNYDFLSESLEQGINANDTLAIKNRNDILEKILNRVQITSINQKVTNKKTNSLDLKIARNTPVRLSALIYNNHCYYKIIKLSNTDSTPLFDFIISQDKSFSLPITN